MSRSHSIPENLILGQSQVRQQQGVRDYLSQITAIRLEGDNLESNPQLRQLLRATTLALLDELSIREVSTNEQDGSIRYDPNLIKQDRKGKVLNFLFELGWIQASENKPPLLSLNNSNLSNANLRGFDLRNIDLKRADLRAANLEKVNLQKVQLHSNELEEANLGSANMYQVDLEGVDLKGVNLEGANLKQAYLGGINLEGANLRNTKFIGAHPISVQRVKLSCFWEEAHYKERDSANLIYVEELKIDKSSEPEEPPDCSRWEK